MHIHILGIAGTFMGGIALIAKELGHTVSGQDEHIYPPMSTQLHDQNIPFTSGYSPEDLPQADLFLIGNALSRGNKCIEYILDNNLNYTSAPLWLGENVLKNKWVIAVSGTHGKTTTSSIVTHILDDNGLNPSFLIGGICENFGISSRLTNSPFFVIEADEYDTAFFDKRSKFIHYYPNTLIINNVEFDHADIFNSIEDIYQQFHNLIRTLPQQAQIIYPQDDTHIQTILQQGVWSQQKSFTTPDFAVQNNQTIFEFEDEKICWNLLGKHNINNAIAALLACHHAGVPLHYATQSLASFKGVKRRLEIKFQDEDVTIYDDFAHHPTSIQTTIAGLKKHAQHEKIIVVLELRSNTMKSGYFNQELIQSLQEADEVLVLQHLINSNNATTYNTTDEIITALRGKTGNIVFMSNGGFEGIIERFITTLTR
jgi:UDP-N-acetylmuramate: L-alanyl-gamma-D-glutamyl-meso-diaminopimelate ligase